MKVNVLGIEYDINVINHRNRYMIERNADGYCDFTSKKIVVCGNDSDYDDKEIYIKEIIRHELIHAFLFECGIDNGYGFHNENLVNWLAVQYPKIKNRNKSWGGNQSFFPWRPSNSYGEGVGM